MVEALDLSSLLPTLVPVPASGVNVTLSGGSTLAVVVFSVANDDLAPVREAVVATLGTPALASAALQIAVLDVAPVAYSEACAADGSDDACDDWSEAAWSSVEAEYAFYLYDETPDERQLKLWQWPRVDPTAGFFRESGFCDDGQNSTTGAPLGEYHLTFGGPACATSSVVATQTGSYGGCGRVAYTPCATGFDCADCGRAQSVSGGGRRKLATQRPRRAFPPLRDMNGTLALMRSVKRGIANGSIVGYELPWFHMRLLEQL